jgi:hypothetical protein
MALHERDVVYAVDEVRRLREDVTSARAAYESAERSRAGRLRAGWFALTSALRGRDTDPLRALAAERNPAVELTAGRPARWPDEARSAARQRRARLRTEAAELARNLADARELLRALATERDAARGDAADLRARTEALRAAAARSEALRYAARRDVERLQADVELLREGLARAKAAAEAFAAERDAERDTARATRAALEFELDAERARGSSSRASLAELQAVVERERHSARDVLNANLQLAAALELAAVRAAGSSENVAPRPTVQASFERALTYTERSGLLFVGEYEHAPSVDAALWLCRSIMPIVWRTHPQLELTLAGSKPPASVLELASNRVHVTGDVADVTPYFERARVFVAPLRHGSGLKGELGLAFSHGVPAVTTLVGADGFDLVDGSDALLAEDAAGFARAIVRAYGDPVLWNVLSAARARRA